MERAVKCDLQHGVLNSDLLICIRFTIWGVFLELTITPYCMARWCESSVDASWVFEFGVPFELFIEWIENQNIDREGSLLLMQRTLKFF